MTTSRAVQKDMIGLIFLSRLREREREQKESRAPLYCQCCYPDAKSQNRCRKVQGRNNAFKLSLSSSFCMTCLIIGVEERKE